MLKTCVLGLIKIYQMGSRLFPPKCRFYPSCSTYTAQAVERHGVLIGAVLAIGRLSRCHPLHPGGLDPVPAQPPGFFKKMKKRSA